MLFSCNKKCPKSSSYTTEGKLDVELNEVICQDCGDVIEGISKFAKTSMRILKDIVRKNKKPFVFECLSCNRNVKALVKDGVVVGESCESENYGCKLNISRPMKVALKEYGNNKDE